MHFSNKIVDADKIMQMLWKEYIYNLSLLVLIAKLQVNMLIREIITKYTVSGHYSTWKITWFSLQYLSLCSRVKYH